LRVGREESEQDQGRAERQHRRADLAPTAGGASVLMGDRAQHARENERRAERQQQV
jgi:hypothetical protein